MLQCVLNRQHERSWSALVTQINAWYQQVEVYDAFLDENKKLADFTAEDLSNDPLLFLHCGHVFPMSTLDGLLQLDSSFARDGSGAWSDPQELQVISLKLLAIEITHQLS